MQQSITKTHLAHGIEKTEYEAQYDENVKVLLSDKQVLARIAKHRTEEFKTYDILTIMECIEGEPEISKISVYPGKKKCEVITGMNTESKETNEGEVTFDVRFYMVTKNQKRIKIILNVEAPERDSDTITEYYLAKKDVYGNPVEGGKFDYLSISFIRLSTGKKWNSKDKLINMLDTLFSNKMDVTSKKMILENEHQMRMTRELEGGIDTMCNVSLGIREQALEEGMNAGMSAGIEEGIKVMILTCKELGLSKDEILDRIIKNSSVTEDVAKALIEKYAL